MRSGNWRSRTASAANLSASEMSSTSRSGCSERISSWVIPSATIATTVATGNRRPRISDPGSDELCHDESGQHGPDDTDQGRMILGPRQREVLVVADGSTYSPISHHVIAIADGSKAHGQRETDACHPSLNGTAARPRTRHGSTSTTCVN